jgi:hypothetical protein
MNLSNDVSDLVLVVWLAIWFIIGVLGCAATLDQFVGRWGVNLWKIAGIVLVLGVLTLFMMFIFPELVFDWDFCFQRGGCSTA